MRTRLQPLPHGWLRCQTTELQHSPAISNEASPHRVSHKRLSIIKKPPLSLAVCYRILLKRYATASNPAIAKSPSNPCSSGVCTGVGVVVIGGVVSGVALGGSAGKGVATGCTGSVGSRGYVSNESMTPSPSVSHFSALVLSSKPSSSIS